MDKKQMMALTIAALVAHAESLAAKLTALATDVENAGTQATAEQLAAIRAVQSQLKDAQDVIAEKEASAKESQDLVAKARQQASAVADLSKPIRKTAPDAVARVTGGDKPGAGKGTFGFQSLGEYVKAARESKATGSLEKRISAAVSTYGREAVLPDGGFAVPPDYAEIIEKLMDDSDESLVRFVDERDTSSNRYVQPIDEEKPWTGGISVSWDGEGEVATGQKPKLGKLEIPVHKVRGLVHLSDELLEDAPAIQSMATTGFAEALVYALNEAIVNGDGVGKPLGFLASLSKVEVPKKSGQAADTIVADNISAMWARLHRSARASAIWLINQDVEAQLPLMTIGNQPVYLPPGGLTGLPYGTIFGRPVISSEEMAELGNAGDIALVGGKSYLLMKRRGSTLSSSMHFAFDQDLQSLKVVARYGGASKWRKAMARKNGGTNTLTNVVTLAARA